MDYLDLARRGAGLPAFVVAALLTVAGCVGGNVPYGLPTYDSRPAVDPAGSDMPLPPAAGEVIGSGATRATLLLPLTGEANAGRIAAELRNAALLAMEDAASNGGPGALELVIKDTGGTEEGTAAAAAQAVAERAAAVLGPLFSANVRAAAAVLAGAGTPMIAFSSDRAAAAPGVYLNSFLPQDVIRRTLRYAAGNGVRSLVAILPEGVAGDVAEAEARRTMLETGGALVAVARYRYDNGSVYAAVRGVADAIRAADAVFIPDGGNSPSTILAHVSEAGIDLAQKKILGTGQWATADLSDPQLAGAWFADTDQERVASYKQRYQARFGAVPSLTSALAYDTVVLAAGIARATGAIPPGAVENPVGFAGYTGLFRFARDGTAERAYAIYEVRGGAAAMIDPAPARFAGAS